MPQKILASNIIICERVLEEKGDGVLSAIRMAEVFYVPAKAVASPEKYGIQIQVLINTKAQLGDDGEHHFLIRMIRPSGDASSLLEKSQVIVSKIPSAPAGANFVLVVGVIVKEIGTHYITLEVDGEEIDRAPFTLLPLPDEPMIR